MVFFNDKIMLTKKEVGVRFRSNKHNQSNLMKTKKEENQSTAT